MNLIELAQWWAVGLLCLLLVAAAAEDATRLRISNLTVVAVMASEVVFAHRVCGVSRSAAANAENNETTKPGPANPQGSSDLDAPTPPGGPMRSDAPSGGNAPGGPIRRADVVVAKNYLTEPESTYREEWQVTGDERGLVTSTRSGRLERVAQNAGVGAAVPDAARTWSTV